MEKTEKLSISLVEVEVSHWDVERSRSLEQVKIQRGRNISNSTSSV